MYSPKIEPKQVQQLYLIKNAYADMGIKRPMTKIVRDALIQYIPIVIKEIEEAGGKVFLADELIAP